MSRTRMIGRPAGIDTPGYASLIIVILSMGAIQLVSIGIIGEYIGRMFITVNQRPQSVVRDVVKSEV